MTQPISNIHALKLRDLVTAILEDSQNHEDAVLHINQIHNIFQELSDITGSDNAMENLAAVPTSRGKALGLNHAAQCLLDYKRTVKFLFGMTAAIKEQQELEPNTTINIFYAGCGPYAPFVCMIAPLFSSSEVQFSLLEINSASLAAAKKLIKGLDLEIYIKDYFLEDAVTFKVPNANEYHIIYSETLDAVLFRECYVPILFNLLPQFKSTVTLIPENVIVDLKFAMLHKKGEEVTDVEETPVGIIVDARAAVTANANPNAIPAELPSITFALTNMDRYNLVVIDTQVIVYKDIALERWESSLTIPLEMNLEQPFDDCKMEFIYHMEPEIELKYTILKE